VVEVVDHDDGADDGHGELDRQLGDGSLAHGYLDGDDQDEERDGDVQVEVRRGEEVVQVGEVYAGVVEDGEGPHADDGDGVEGVARADEPGIFLGLAGQVERDGEGHDHIAYDRDEMMRENEQEE